MENAKRLPVFMFVSLLLGGCATLPPDLNPFDAKNEQRLLQLQAGTSRQDVIQRVRKPDAIIHFEEDTDKSCEIDFYAFEDRFISPTRLNSYLISFKDGQLIRVVRTETQPYSQATGFQNVVEALRRRRPTKETDVDSSEPERLHLLFSMRSEACTIPVTRYDFQGGIDQQPR